MKSGDFSSRFFAPPQFLSINVKNRLPFWMIDQKQFAVHFVSNYFYKSFCSEIIFSLTAESGHLHDHRHFWNQSNYCHRDGRTIGIGEPPERGGPRPRQEAVTKSGYDPKTMPQSDSGQGAWDYLSGHAATKQGQEAKAAETAEAAEAAKTGAGRRVIEQSTQANHRPSTDDRTATC